MNKLLLIVLCLILFSECNYTRHNSELTTINIIGGIRRSIKMSASVISNDILFIPLETFDENIVAKITNILIYDDYIIVIDDLPQILLFNKTFLIKQENLFEKLEIQKKVKVNFYLYILRLL
jgi:hypothetical protein